MTEIYVSTDIETDGFMPGENSMLSLGSAAYLPDGRLLGTWSSNFETLPGAHMDPSTAQFWAREPDAWEMCRRDLRAPVEALPDYAAWLRALPGQPVFVGYPVTFDFMFVGWYLVRFARDNPFGFAAIDISSFAMAALGREFRQTTKHHMPREWFDPALPHTHVALEDALEQGALFVNLLQANRRALTKLRTSSEVPRYRDVPP